MDSCDDGVNAANGAQHTSPKGRSPKKQKKFKTFSIKGGWWCRCDDDVKAKNISEIWLILSNRNAPKKCGQWQYWWLASTNLMFIIIVIIIQKAEFWPTWLMKVDNMGPKNPVCRIVSKFCVIFLTHCPVRKIQTNCVTLHFWWLPLSGSVNEVSKSISIISWEISGCTKWPKCVNTVLYDFWLQTSSPASPRAEQPWLTIRLTRV